MKQVKSIWMKKGEGRPGEASWEADPKDREHIWKMANSRLTAWAWETETGSHRFFKGISYILERRIEHVYQNTFHAERQKRKKWRKSKNMDAWICANRHAPIDHAWNTIFLLRAQM